jgi:hypothetical protein
MLKDFFCKLIFVDFGANTKVIIIMKRTLLTLIFLLICISVIKAQQTRVVYGKVTVLNGLPVSGVEVKAAEAQTSTVTDSLGGFSIVCNRKDKLKFSGKSFNPTITKISHKTQDSIFVKLHFTPTEENVELAIGYGYISEKHRTQAVQYLPKGCDYSNYNNIFDVIKYRFNNVSIQNNCVIIRGPHSIYGSNCALYVVDGVIVNNIDYILPSEVKEISMIKDGSSSIYGNQGSNGVILINLKDGK